MSAHAGIEWWRRNPAVLENQVWTAATRARTGEPSGALPFWALIAFTFVLLLAPQLHFPALASLRPALLTAALAIAAHLFDSFRRRLSITILPREMGVAGCLVSWAILTIPFSYWPAGSVSFLFDAYFKSLALFWLLSNVVSSVRRLRRIFWALALAGPLLAVTGVHNFLSGSFMPEGAAVKRIIGYEAPLTGNPNDLALMLNLILPLTVALCLMQGKSAIRAAFGVMIALEILAVILTFSRGGFLTLATIFVLYWRKFRSRPEKRWLWTALVVMALCLPLLASSYMARLATITDIDSDPTGSSQSRWRDMVAAATFAVGHPIIGAGVGMDVLALNQERGPYWLAVHNVYLQHAVDLGIPGLALFLMLLAGCIRSAAFVQQQCKAAPAFRDLFYLAEGVQVSLVAFALAAFFYPVAYHFYFYYMAGLALAVSAVFEAERRLCGTIG